MPQTLQAQEAVKRPVKISGYFHWNNSVLQSQARKEKRKEKIFVKTECHPLRICCFPNIVRRQFPFKNTTTKPTTYFADNGLKMATFNNKLFCSFQFFKWRAEAKQPSQPAWNTPVSLFFCLLLKTKSKGSKLNRKLLLLKFSAVEFQSPSPREFVMEMLANHTAWTVD